MNHSCGPIALSTLNSNQALRHNRVIFFLPHFFSEVHPRNQFPSPGLDYAEQPLAFLTEKLCNESLATSLLMLLVDLWVLDRCNFAVMTFCSERNSLQAELPLEIAVLGVKVLPLSQALL